MRSLLLAFALIVFSSIVLLSIFRRHYHKLQEAFSAVPTGLSPIPREMTQPSQETTNIPIATRPVDYAEVNRSFRKADFHFSKGQFEEAEKWFIRVLSLHEDHPETLNRLGVIAIQQGNFAKAEILFRKLIAKNGGEAVYLSNFGRCLYAQKKYAEAIAAYEKAIQVDPRRAARFISLGQIYYELTEFDKALENFRRAVSLEPRNIEYLTLLAELYELRGHSGELSAVLKKILLLDPYNEEAKRKMERMKLEEKSKSPN